MRQVVCLKWGDKYSPDYVNRLQRMVRRHLTGDLHFYCVTDDSTGLAAGTEVIPLPEQGLTGWWNKLWLFSPEFPLRGPCLFLDLDIVVAAPIDCLFEHEPERAFCSIRDFSRDEFNTSVVRWQAGDARLAAVWAAFGDFVARLERSPWQRLALRWHFWRWRLALKARKRIRSAAQLTHLGRYRGDQKWLSEHIRHQPWAGAFPSGWCFSYKWGADKAEARRSGRAPGQWQDGGRIAVFEGRPKPHECGHVSWVADNWG